MYELTELIKDIGSISLDNFWFPIMIWTACCAIAFLFLKTQEKLHPLFHYHLRTAALLSLPLGIGISAVMSKIPNWFASANLETAFFIVHNPIEIVSSATSASGEMAVINWQEPAFFVGAVTVIVALISVFMLGRLMTHYVALRRLYKNLNLTKLQDFNDSDSVHAKSSIKLAFHDHPLVPFTFGWKQPVIVLPKILQHEPEKLNMALQHELTHIKRGDYLLQLALSMIESLFWFHPLIRYGNQEIDTYREISCDQEVLSKSDFSIKSYANLLYELVPLNTGVGKLSVSMAVKNSTLKKRIKTMKYHKLHKASFRQSVFFLFLMILGITLPIACSDLRGPESISSEELEQTQIQISEPTISVNGIELDTKNMLDLKTTGLGALQIITSDYGMFKIAPRKFKDGIKAGTFDGNSLSFEFNQLKFELHSSVEIIPGVNKASLWVSHNDVKVPNNLLYAMDNALTLMPPPPPSPMAPADPTEEGDFFVVVEKMPELIDGMAALQAKVEYPEEARRNGIEGRVTVQFIINEQGNVENAKVVRGIGSGADEVALKAVEQAKFEPGIQRGRAVRVQYALSINFRLEDSDFSSEADNSYDGVIPQEMNVTIIN